MQTMYKYKFFKLVFGLLGKSPLSNYFYYISQEEIITNINSEFKYSKEDDH